MEIRRKIKKCSHASSRTLIEKKAEMASHEFNGPCLAKKSQTIDFYVQLRGPISSHDRNGLCVSKRFRFILHTAAAKKCFTSECITLHQIVFVSHWLTHIRCPQTTKNETDRLGTKPVNDITQEEGLVLRHTAAEKLMSVDTEQ